MDGSVDCKFNEIIYKEVMQSLSVAFNELYCSISDNGSCKLRNVGMDFIDKKANHIKLVIAKFIDLQVENYKNI